MRQQTRLSLDQTMACRCFGAKPLSEPMLLWYQLDPWKHILIKSYSKFIIFHSRKCICKCHLQNGGYFVSATMQLMTIANSKLHLTSRQVHSPFVHISQWFSKGVDQNWGCEIVCGLTHWGRVTHICVGNLTTIGSDNGLSPGWRQATIWTTAGILLIGTLGTNFSAILSEIPTFSFKKFRFKTSSAKWRPFCLGLNELRASNIAFQENKNVDKNLRTHKYSPLNKVHIF